MIVTPCSLCLRECSTGHCFIFDFDAVVASPRGPGDDSTVVYETASDRQAVMWSGPDAPSPSDDLAAGLIGDPVDWVVMDSRFDGERARARCPYWILKSRTQAAAAALENERPTQIWRGSGAPQPTSSAPSGSSLTRSYAMRQTPAPTIGRLGTFDLSSPNGEDVHAVLEGLQYGSLSLSGADRTAKPARPNGPYARPRASQVVGR